MIVLVRHGRTDANARGLLLGRADPPLDDEGRRQAALLARGLGELDLVRVVSSPLTRCRQTADTLVAMLAGDAGGRAPVEVEIDERWIELDYGELDGLPASGIAAATRTAWREDIGWAPEGGESLAGLGERVRAACHDLVADAQERDVVVVSHVSPIKAAVAWALGVSDTIAWRMWVAPGSISRIGCGGPAPTLRSFNEVAHLG